jgi:hypothetical protein
MDCGRAYGREHLHRRCLFLRRRGRGAAMSHAHVAHACCTRAAARQLAWAQQLPGQPKLAAAF